MSNEHFPLRCNCGTVHSVTMGMCGLDIPCGCGVTVHVPSSLKLREMAGLSPVEPEPELVIAEMVQAGELPLASCIVCGLDADTVHYWLVECQRQHTGSESQTPLWAWVLFGPVLWLVMGPFAILRLQQSFDDETEVHGRDVYVRAPYRACDYCLPVVSTSWMDSLLKFARWLILVAGFLIVFANPLVGLSVMAASIVPRFVQLLHAKKLRKTRRKCLQKMPMFTALFRKYPDAVIVDER